MPKAGDVRGRQKNTGVSKYIDFPDSQNRCECSALSRFCRAALILNQTNHMIILCAKQFLAYLI